MAVPAQLETGVDRDPAAFAARLREVANDIERGAALHGYRTFEKVAAEEQTKIAVAFSYTPTTNE